MTSFKFSFLALVLVALIASVSARVKPTPRAKLAEPVITVSANYTAMEEEDDSDEIEEQAAAQNGSKSTTPIAAGKTNQTAEAEEEDSDEIEEQAAAQNGSKSTTPIAAGKTNQTDEAEEEDSDEIEQMAAAHNVTKIPPKLHRVVCEGQSMALICTKGKLNVVSAVYGRQSKAFCWSKSLEGKKQSLTCKKDATSVVAKSCNKKAKCVLKASNSMTGDPCVGTRKYLSIHYNCV